MKLRILMPIKYKFTQKEIILIKLTQYYGSKIVHLLQDNEITKSSPQALKDAKTWTPPVIACDTRSVGATSTFCPRRHIH